MAGVLCVLCKTRFLPRLPFDILGVEHGFLFLQNQYKLAYDKKHKKRKMVKKYAKNNIKNAKNTQNVCHFAKNSSLQSLEKTAPLYLYNARKNLLNFMHTLSHFPNTFLLPLSCLYKYKLALLSVCQTLKKECEKLHGQTFRHIQSKCVVSMFAWFFACDMLLKKPMSLQGVLTQIYAFRKPTQKEIKALPTLICLHIISLLYALVCDVQTMHKQIQKGKQTKKFSLRVVKQSPAFLYGAYAFSEAKIALFSVHKKAGVKATKHVVKESLQTKRHIEHLVCWLFEIIREKEQARAGKWRKKASAS